MPKLRLHAFDSPSQTPSGPTSDTTSKESNKKSIFRTFGSKSRSFLSKCTPSPSSSKVSRNTSFKMKAPAPTPIFRGFSESLAKIPNMMPRTPSSTCTPKTKKSETIKRSRTYTAGIPQTPESLDDIGGTSEGGFELISVGEPESPSDARLRMKRAVSFYEVDGRLSDSESVSPSQIPFPKMSPLSPQEPAQEDLIHSAEPDNEEKVDEFRPLDAVGIVPPDALHTLECAADSQILHIARFLQNAARHARAHDTCSQQAIFHASAPLLLFAFVMAIGVLLPRYYAALHIRFGSDLQTFIALVILGGAFSVLLLLRGTIWVLSVLGKLFCEMDLKIVSRKGDCIAVDGTRIGEAELVLGSFLFG